MDGFIISNAVTGPFISISQQLGSNILIGVAVDQTVK